MRTRQDWVGDWVRSNDTLVRGLPIFIGGVSLLAVLLNRAVSGIAAVSDASRSPYPALTSATVLLYCVLFPLLLKLLILVYRLLLKQFAVEG
jgi:hypothetical protein